MNILKLKQIKMKTQRKHLRNPLLLCIFGGVIVMKIHINHIERTPVAVKDIDHLFRMASEMIEAVSVAIRNERVPSGSK